MIQLPTFEGLPGRLKRKPTFEHECHGVCHPLRLQINVRGLFKSCGIRTMRSHTVMQTRSSRNKAISFGIVFSTDQPHELAHEVPVKVRWPKGFFGHHPARWEDHKIHISGAWRVRG